MPGSVRRSAALIGVAAVVVGEAALIHLGRTYGSTVREQNEPLPGDGLIDRPTVQTDHAVSISAPPADIWPWLLQLGWGRAGWYTGRWVDLLLFPANGPSAERVIPELQHLDVGSFIPDGPPETGCGFTVEILEHERALVLRSNSHLPRGVRDRATVDWTWAFVLRSDDGRTTRFHFRSRWVTHPWWLSAVGLLGIVPADFVMSRDMLRGVKRRAESPPPAQ